MSHHGHVNSEPTDPGLLLSGYLENKLNARQFDELVQWIHADRENARTFMRHCMMVEHIRDELRWDDVAELPIEEISSESSDMLRSFQDLLQEEEKQPTVVVDISDEMQRRQSEAAAKEPAQSGGWRTLAGQPQGAGPQTRHYVIPKPLFYGSIAAVIAIAAMIIWPIIAPQEQPDPPPVVAAVPKPVAVVVDQVDARWEGVSAPITTGGVIYDEPLKLVSGYAKLKFNNEAEVILEAPCVLNPLSAWEVELTKGKLVGHCHTARSRGFTVRAPSATIVDLGTEFGVAVEKTGQSKITVFSGLVRGHFEGKEEPRNLESGLTVHYDSVTKVLDEAELDPATFKRTWDHVLYQPAWSGPVLFEVTTPPDLSKGALVDKKRARMYLERRNVQMAPGSVVTLSRPGRYDQFNDRRDVIRGTPTVDSYLIRFDPQTGAEKKYAAVRATVTFPRPIVGIIANDKQLNATDALYGNATTRYSHAILRGIAGHMDIPQDADYLIIAEDQRTVTLHLRASVHIDAFRVLIEAAPPSMRSET